MSYERDEHGNQDPEVVDDLLRRAASERDASRSRKPAPLFAESPTVAQWPCKARCGAQVDITATVIEAWRMFNRQLVSRGEDKLDAGQIVICHSCRAKLLKLEGEKAREYADKMRAYIGDLKDAVAMGDVAKEREIVKRLTGRHPDVTGLVESLRNAKKSKRGGSDRRDL